MAGDKHIKIPRLTWMGLVRDLRKRGQGCRESGAFLLGKVDSADRRVESFICYDDLDPQALEDGIIVFHACGFSALWELCSKRGLEVLVDVHTHPTADVRQSDVDKEYPMLPVMGHIALILPRYGKTSKWSLSGVGVNVYQGARQWSSTRGDAPQSPIQLCIW